MKINPYTIAAGAGVLAVLYIVLRGAKEAGRDAAAATVGTAVDLTDGVLQGSVEAIGERIGIPKTDEEKCNAAKAAGKTWDASRYCRISQFFNYLIGADK
jgi:hypothetical protein